MRAHARTNGDFNLVVWLSFLQSPNLSYCLNYFKGHCRSIKHKEKIHWTALVAIECFMYFFIYTLNVSCVQTKSQNFLKFSVLNV